MTTPDTEVPPTRRKQIRTVSRFREALPQVLAMGAANMVVLNLTLALFLSTLVIGELHHPDAELSMDDTLASWFGSLPFFCQPIGSIASGFMVHWLGRRTSLTLINVPYFLGCVLISMAPSITVLFLANILMGTTVGLTEAPINSYFGEICQPELRSILAGSAAIFSQIGMFTLFLLGSLLNWRTTAGVVAVFPAMTLIMLSRVPESPIWLISKGRLNEAEAALCWLRGWVDRSAVQQELAELVKYHDSVIMKSAPKLEKDAKNKIPSQTQSPLDLKSNPELTSLLYNGIKLPSDDQAVKQMTDVNAASPSFHDRTPTIGDVLSPEKDAVGGREESEQMTLRIDNSMTEYGLKTEMTIAGSSEESRKKSKFVAMVKLLLEPETLRPFFLIVSFFSFYGFGGMPSIRPFLVEVLERFHAPIEGTWSTLVMATTGLLGSVVLIGSVSRFGKRSIALTSTAICAVACLLLGLFDYFFVASVAETGGDSYLIATWVPLVVFAVFSFANIIQGQIPWLLVAEAFPFRTRGVAGGMAAASNYIASFLAAKTFLSTEHSLQLYGTFWLFCTINCGGFLYLYFLLPETEGKSLEEIERLFAGNKRDTK